MPSTSSAIPCDDKVLPWVTPFELYSRELNTYLCSAYESGTPFRFNELRQSLSRHRNGLLILCLIKMYKSFSFEDFKQCSKMVQQDRFDCVAQCQAPSCELGVGTKAVPPRIRQLNPFLRPYAQPSVPVCPSPA